MMYFGCSYYPEHWPEERWLTDVKMMKEANFNVVRMAEFAWTKMEPHEGEYHFEWLDHAIELMASHGLQTILGTPTAAPPKWLIDKYPDIHQEDYQGHKKGYGHRRYVCFNNHNLQYHAAAISKVMAQRYGNNKNVIGWQIDNELGCVDTVRCFCSSCRKEFQVWLRKKYRSIENLNEKWGTVFSNQTYGCWEEIILPAYGPVTLHNPGLELDFRRFSSDSVLKFACMQRDILKSYISNQMVTTNIMDRFTQLDYFSLATSMDICASGMYPNCLPSSPPDPCESAFQFEIMRGAGGANFWVLEMQSGTPGGNVMFKTPRPGDLKRWTYQAIAHGADCIVYFRWRTCLFGVEEYWHGILDHSGLVNRKYEEVKTTGKEIHQLEGLIEGSMSDAEVAILYSYELAWVFEIQPHVREYDYPSHFARYYTHFFNHNIPVDFISPERDLSHYKLIIVPNLIMADDDLVVKLNVYVKNGGVVIMDYRTGAKDIHNRMLPLPLPGPFREMLGIVVEEYGVLLKDETVSIKLVDSDQTYTAGTWYDVVCPESAEVIAVYDQDYFKGKAAVTKNLFGQGEAYYIGTQANETLLDHLLNRIRESCGIEPDLSCDNKNIEISRRRKEDHSFYFVINHGNENTKITLHQSYIELLSNRQLHGEVDLLPNEVLVLDDSGLV